MVKYNILTPNWKEDECLKKSEILFFGKDILNNSLESSSMRTMHPDLIYFLLKCITDLIHHHKCFKFTPRQKKEISFILKPYKKKYVKIADPKKRGQNVKLIQKGKGFLISSLIAAVAPIVLTLVKKAVSAISKGFKK